VKLGTDPTGTLARPNYHGALGEMSQNGTLVISDGSVVSGNLSHGVVGASVVENSKIGTNAAGSADLGNGGSGVLAAGPFATFTGNVISGNGQHGLWLTPTASRARVQANRIGTNAAVNARIANEGTGLLIQSDNSTIGDPDWDRNTISGNNRGVEIRPDPASGVAATGNRIQLTYIGTNASDANLGNAAEGVLIASSFNTIGSADKIFVNRIAFNGFSGAPGHRAGVVVESGTGNRIQSYIYANAELGIDLAPAGVNPNDDDDADTGPNGLQNAPVLTAATVDADSTDITGTLEGRPSTTYALEFFFSRFCDPSGFGEGNFRIHTASVTTDSSGQASFNESRKPRLPVGQFVTATATDPQGNTSEFSNCQEIVAAPPAFASFEPVF
jgi:hypothetical protein